MFYADYNSTAPIHPLALRAMQPFLEVEFGNPSSKRTALGKIAYDEIESARKQVARLVDALPEEVVFTSGGTESCLHAILGALLANPDNLHAITSSVEHPAVSEAFAIALQKPFFVALSEIGVNQSGALCWGDFIQSLALRPAIVSLMLANNETGALFPIADAARSSKAAGSIFHTDATQAVGRIPVSFAELGVDLMSFTGHKIGAPKGIGALIVREGSKWQPLMKGGGQQQGRRGGTDAVSQIVGFGEACRVASDWLEDEGHQRLELLRDIFEQQLLALLPDVIINCEKTERLPNTTSVQVPGVAADELLSRIAAAGVICSAGSACATNDPHPSHVLQALGLSTLECLSTFRFSFGPETNEKEIEEVAVNFSSIIFQAREENNKFIANQLGQ